MWARWSGRSGGQDGLVDQKDKMAAPGVSIYHMISTVWQRNSVDRKQVAVSTSINTHTHTQVVGLRGKKRCKMD